VKKLEKNINDLILMNEREKELENKIEKIIKENPKLIIENKILEVEFNLDGTKKDIYSLASEKDIKETQIKSDLNEIDYKYYHKIISKDEYERKKEELEQKLLKQIEVYNDLIFKIINTNEINSIMDSIKKYNLNDIDLTRLAKAITSVTEEKVEEFINNNKKFMISNIEYWDYKYKELSMAISKTREVENFILSLISKNK
jgi:hypothetical protein